LLASPNGRRRGHARGHTTGPSRRAVSPGPGPTTAAAQGGRVDPSPRCRRADLPWTTTPVA